MPAADILMFGFVLVGVRVWNVECGMWAGHSPSACQCIQNANNRLVRA